MCLICNQVVDEDGSSSIACDWCDIWYHSSCLKIPKAAFKFLSEARDEKKYGSFQWLCPTCCQHDNKSKPQFQKFIITQSEQQQRISNLELQVAKLMSISCQPSLLEEKSSSSSHEDKLSSTVVEEPKKNTGSYAKVVVNSVKNAIKRSTGISSFKPSTDQVRAKPTEVVVLKKSVDTSSLDKVKLKESKELVSKSLAKVEMCFMKVNDTSGEITIGFPNKDSKNTALKCLENLDMGFSIMTKAKNLPKLTITRIPLEMLDGLEDQPNLQKVHLRETILEKSDELLSLCNLGHTFEIVYFKTIKDYINIGIKVSPLIREWILNRGFLFIGNSCCPALDRMVIKQCFHCQKIGHLAKECPDKNLTPTCLYCAKGHRSAICPNKGDCGSHMCSNCSNGNNKHKSNSYDCPIIKHEIERLQQKIDYTSKNVI